MPEQMEQCWDCPSRRGRQKVTGWIALRFWEVADMSGNHIRKQRGGCEGAVPAPEMYDPIPQETGDTKWKVTYTWQCPRQFNDIPKVPGDVSDKMSADPAITSFTYEYTESRQAQADAS